MARAKSKNVAKGVAVRRQNDAWARALRTRIVLQKSVGVVAKFPTPRYHAAMRSEDDDVAPAMEEAARAAKAALAVLGTLQAALLDANPAVDEARAEEEEEEEPSFAKILRVESARAAFARRTCARGVPPTTSGRRSTRRTPGSRRSAIGRAIGGTGRRTCRPGRRRHRRRRRRAGRRPRVVRAGGERDAASGQAPRALPLAHLAPRRLGEPKVGTLPGAHDAGDRDEKVAGEDDAPDASALSSGNDQGRVEELYDDADFYEQSLKEFLESRGGARRRRVWRRTRRGRRSGGRR